MTVDINELRRLASRYVGISVSSPVSPQGLIELLDRLEAAEQTAQDCVRIDGEKARIAQRLEAAENEIQRLKQTIEAQQLTYREMVKEYQAAADKIAAMERQEPAAFALYSGWARKAVYLSEIEACEQRDRRQLTADLGGSLEAYRVVPLYALPGAKALLRVPDAVMAALDSLDDYIARIECNDRGACNHINLLRRYLLDATEVGENK